MQSKYLPAEERRSLTVEAVVVLSGAQNPSEITTAAIAKHMNVTQGALFRHFPTKDAIWEAVMEWVTNRLLDRIDHAAEGACSPMDGLRAMFMSHIEFVIEYPGVPRMMFGELQRAEAAPATKIARMLIKRYAERLAKKLEEAKAAGEAANDLDTHAAAILFIGMIQGLVMQSLLSGDIKAVRTHAHGVLGIYLRGVKSGASDAETLNARTPRGKIRR
ncbi:MAG: transcriptional regulator TetR family [Methylocystaceae bacterium]|nr:MAG: transcriptional regulator TetR family [Methylocystaceae bacterium]